MSGMRYTQQEDRNITYIKDNAGDVDVLFYNTKPFLRSAFSVHRVNGVPVPVQLIQ